MGAGDEDGRSDLRSGKSRPLPKTETGETPVKASLPVACPTYTVADLAQAASQPWQAFAAWADPRLPAEQSDRVKPDGMVYEHGYHCDPWNYDSDYDYSDWRMVALSTFCDCLSFFIGGDIWDHLKKTLGLDYRRWPDQFISMLNNHPERLDGILNDAVRCSTYCQSQSGEGCDSSDAHLRQVKLMSVAIRTPEGLERLFWEELKFCVTEILPELRAIESAIREGRPLGDRDLENMALWLNTGTLVPLEVCDNKGAIRGEMRVRANWSLLRGFSVVDKHVFAVFLPVGYSLCEAWVKSQAWPRFVATCRNPSCGRSFYSGRPDAVACPKPAHKRGTSPCKREWDRYRRWLVKIGRNAETEWADPQLQKRYCGH